MTDTETRELDPLLSSLFHSKRRDVKPQNFMYIDDTADSVLKCSDYGLALSYIPNDPLGVTLTKRAGTPAYMAPELILRRYDERADLW